MQKTTGKGFSEFGRRFEELVAQVESADVRVPEDSALISLATDLVPKVVHLLRAGVELLTDIEKLYGPAYSPEAEDSDSLSQIGLQISTELAARDLRDMSFFARTDLKSSLETLIASATHKSNQMTLASNCEGGLRRLRKALISVESTVYEFENQPAPERHWFDVEVSLQIRKLYWNLRRETGGTAGNEDRPLEARLRAVLYRILAFRELSVYPFLRVDDRVHLRRLLKRILDWLNSDQQDPAIGRRLWQDLSSFAEILVQVSHRQELRDHDLKLVSRAYRTLFPFGARRRTVPDELMDELQALLGLDDELDHLIATRMARPVEGWRRPLKRLQASLSHAGELSGPPEIWPG
ncbi:MAG: hypothetical protein GY719_13170 [bacterium]|nr:hypothetical protein [bacterium]